MSKSLVRRTSGIGADGEGQQPPLEYNSSPSLEVKFAAVATQVKLLLKLIRDHKDAIKGNKNDGRKRLRVATMLTILENIRLGIQRCQFKTKTTETDRGASSSTSSNSAGGRHQRQYTTGEDDKEMLKKKIHAASEARKDIQLACSDLANDKRRISIELSKTLYLIKETEERINDLKTHNQILAKKVNKCKTEHKFSKGYKKCCVGLRSAAIILKELHEKSILMEDNDTLAEDLEAAVRKCQSMERKQQHMLHKHALIRREMDVIAVKVRAGQEIFNQFKQNMASRTDDTPAYIRKQIARFDRIFELFQKMGIK